MLENYDDEIDIKDLIHALIDGKWTIGITTSIFILAALFYSLSLSNIYQSQALVVPLESSNDISNTLSSYSNLASLAGVRLPSENTNNSAKAMKKLNSLSFFENNIMPNIYLPNLMAIKSWDNKNNKIIYDAEIYNVSKKKWVRSISYPQKLTPSAQESFEVFQSKHVTISEDKLTGFVSFIIKHESPYIAKEWVELFIDQINSFYRAEDKKKAEKSVNYLNYQISKSKLTEVKQVLAELLQKEIQKLALIEANEFYVYEYIDPPQVMEKKSAPQRALICIISALLGTVLSIVLVLMRHYIFKEKLT
jgi:hypothetical protein